MRRGQGTSPMTGHGRLIFIALLFSASWGTSKAALLSSAPVIAPASAKDTNISVWDQYNQMLAKTKKRAIDERDAGRNRTRAFQEADEKARISKKRISWSDFEKEWGDGAKAHASETSKNGKGGGSESNRWSTGGGAEDGSGGKGVEIVPGVRLTSSGDFVIRKGLFETKKSGLWCLKSCHKGKKTIQAEELNAEYKIASMRYALATVMKRAAEVAADKAESAASLEEKEGGSAAVVTSMQGEAARTADFAEHAEEAKVAAGKKRKHLREALHRAERRHVQGYCVECVRKCVKEFGRWD